jgi:hypothetical protein
MSLSDKYRNIMISMRSFIDRDTPPKICFTCVGWEHFGGLDAKDVTKGPMCICDKTWIKVINYSKQTNKLLVI